MWKDYSAGFIRKNRASSISLLASAFMAAVFLSLLCSLFFNFWIYEVEKTVREEGDWQGRISGEIDREMLARIENFENVEKAVVNEDLSEGPKIVVDVSFRNARTIYQDLPQIAEMLGLEVSAASYHELLLSRYLIHDPRDEDPPLLLAFYLVVMLLTSLSLVLIIHNSFAVSMNARVRQFGIFSSIGATPGQIRVCLIQEAAVLCLVPILLGSFFGGLLSFGTIQLVNRLTAGVAGRFDAVFQYHPLVFAVTFFASVVTVLFSAWLPAVKLSRLTPLQAIRGVEEQDLKKKKRSPVLARLFGMEGELAGNALKARKKALRTSALSLTLSFLGFTLMLCFFTLSEISTGHTYFERYQDVWDVMVTGKDVRIEDFDCMEKLRELPGVRSAAAYQKARAVISVSEAEISGELREIGGPGAVTGASVIPEEGGYRVPAPIVILDDAGFLAYCEQIGAAPRLDGAILLNRIWDSVNSNFRYAEYLPYIKEEADRITLRSAGPEEGAAEIPVTAYTREVPVLREEYEDYALVSFVPLSLWREIGGQIGNAGTDLFIRILGEEGLALAGMDSLEAEVLEVLRPAYRVESENRIRERMTNDTMLNGYKGVTGGFCALLAVIGIANVFSYTLGFVGQRKREFARYMSVGMTPESMKKMFCVEALVIAGRPLLITLPLTVLSVGFMITASYLDPAEFLRVAPVLPVLCFFLVIFGFVALAYFIGGKKALACSLAEALRLDGAE